MYSKLSTVEEPEGREEGKDEQASFRGPTTANNTTASSSLLVVGLVTFIGDCSRGVLFPVLWPVCERLGET